MRAGQRRFDRVPIYFEPTTLPPEVWVDVTEQMVPGVLPYYMISNYGRLYHKFLGHMMTENLDSKGYPYKPLATINGPQNVRIHRLVLMGFNYIPGCENLIANHIDGVTHHNWIWNLEWVTASENVLHAYRIGLNQGRLSEEKIHEVCKLLENIDNSLQFIYQITGVSYTTVQAIQNKRSHTDISDQYNIIQRKIGNNLDNEQVHKLCYYYSTVPKGNKTLQIYCGEALRYIGVEPNTKTIKTAKKILGKETYTYISKDYNF